MAKKNKQKADTLRPDPNANPQAIVNALMSRAQLLETAWGESRDIDKACGYPDTYTLTATDYREFYDWHGIATRVVQVYPEASWEDDPEVKDKNETNDGDRSEWHKTFDEFENEHSLFHYLHRADELSGIGRYGLIMFGLDDGLELSEPVETVADDGSRQGMTENEITFIRVFDESVVEIAQYDDDETSPRFGMPLMYRITFNDPKDASNTTNNPKTTKQNVHWSRVVHITDTRVSNELFGTPRMQRVFHRLWDIRKILGGAGEMFWRGGFPGIAFEVSPEVAGDVTVDADSMREQMRQYSEGLQRYIAATGLRAKSLAPNIENPQSHFETEVKAIAIALSVPYRVFMGTEEARLAGEKDDKAWRSRVDRRRAKYVGPMLVRPVVDRLIAYGALPETNEYTVEWPQAQTIENNDRVANAKTIAEALNTYVNSGADAIISEVDFLVYILGLDREQAQEIIDRAALVSDEPDDELDLELEPESVPQLPNNPNESEPPQPPTTDGPDANGDDS